MYLLARNLFLAALGIFFIVLLEVSVIPHLPPLLAYLSVVQATAATLTLLFGLRIGLVFSALAGLLLETLTISPFGMITVSLVLSQILLSILLEILFTHVSMLSTLILSIIAVFLYHLFLILSSLVTSLLLGSPSWMTLSAVTWRHIVLQACSTGILVMISVGIARNISRRLNFAFLR